MNKQGYGLDKKGTWKQGKYAKRWSKEL